MIGCDEAKGRAALEKVREHGEATYFKADVSNSSQVKELVDGTIQKYGPIDVLVNNAAVVSVGTVVNTSEEIWDQVMNINMKGVFLVLQVRHPLHAEEGRRGNHQHRLH